MFQRKQLPERQNFIFDYAFIACVFTVTNTRSNLCWGWQRFNIAINTGVLRIAPSLSKDNTAPAMFGWWHVLQKHVLVTVCVLISQSSLFDLISLLQGPTLVLIGILFGPVDLSMDHMCVQKLGLYLLLSSELMAARWRSG